MSQSNDNKFSFDKFVRLNEDELVNKGSEVEVFDFFDFFDEQLN
jgi:hypothetical protein